MLLGCIFLLAIVPAFSGLEVDSVDVTEDNDWSSPVSSVCKQIRTAISTASDVYWPLSSEFEQDDSHSASSSTENATCSVEPGTVEDVGRILRIVGSTRTPFAVKSGGHALNPHFSSTSGVQISLNRFNGTVYDAKHEYAVVGTGQTWNDVYDALEPHGVIVVGGRVSGIGVGGFTLGGGYSWLTNQYGLGLDNVLAYELVLPNGTVTNVTASSNPDLFFGLRGGFNNFGVVTRFTLKTHPQAQVWGGSVLYDGDKFEELQNATSNFISNNEDPKASVIVSFGSAMGLSLVSMLIVYDGPIVPSGVFDELLAIESRSKNVSTQSFQSLVHSFPDSAFGLRQRYHTVSLLEYSKNLLAVISNETLHWGNTLPSDPSKLVAYSVESFTPDLLTHGSNSAYPADRSRPLLPLSISYAWSSERFDDDFVEAIRETAITISRAADAEGQNIGNAILYGNYALEGTPVSRIYGDDLPRLKAIKAKYDPEGVMDLAGGWKI